MIGSLTFAHVEDLRVDEITFSAGRWRLRVSDRDCNTVTFSAASREELGAWLMARAQEVVNAVEPEPTRSKAETRAHYQEQARLACEANDWPENAA